MSGKSKKTKAALKEPIAPFISKEDGIPGKPMNMTEYRERVNRLLAKHNITPQWIHIDGRAYPYLSPKESLKLGVPFLYREDPGKSEPRPKSLPQVTPIPLAFPQVSQVPQPPPGNPFRTGPDLRFGLCAWDKVGQPRPPSTLPPKQWDLPKHTQCSNHQKCPKTPKPMELLKQPELSKHLDFPEQLEQLRYSEYPSYSEHPGYREFSKHTESANHTDPGIHTEFQVPRHWEPLSTMPTTNWLGHPGGFSQDSHGLNFNVEPVCDRLSVDTAASDWLEQGLRTLLQ